MGKCYRFIWNHDQKRFEIPDNWETVESQEHQEVMLKIVQTIRTSSGLIVFNLWLIALILIIVFGSMMTLCGILIAYGKQVGEILLLVCPFLLFAILISLMPKSGSGSLNANRYMEKYGKTFETMVADYCLVIEHSFWQSTVSRDQERSKGTAGSCFQKRCTCGVIEFIKVNESRLSLLRAQLPRKLQILSPLQLSNNNGNSLSSPKMRAVLSSPKIRAGRSTSKIKFSLTPKARVAIISSPKVRIAQQDGHNVDTGPASPKKKKTLVKKM